MKCINGIEYVIQEFKHSKTLYGQSKNSVSSIKSITAYMKVNKMICIKMLDAFIYTKWHIINMILLF